MPRFVLSNELRRGAALQCVREAKLGMVVVIGPPKRNLTINAALHVKIDEVAERFAWAGRRWDSETWKRLLVAAWCRANAEQAIVLPALDGAGVDVVWRRTSDLTQEECRDLMSFIEAWVAQGLH